MRHSYALLQAMKAASLKDGGHLSISSERPMYRSSSLQQARAYALSISEPPMVAKPEDLQVLPTVRPKKRKRPRPGRERR